jgi:branched-subunit amino acid transport protein
MRMPEWLVYILVIALTTFLVRALPFLPIRSPRLRAFLEMVPYATLAAMAFPDMVLSTGNTLSGLAGFLSAVLVGWLGGGLIRVAGAACLAVLVFELIL